jgi:hypothetical protein
MKRLFILRDRKTNHPFMGIPKDNGPLAFANKQDAKARRDEVKQELGYDLKVSPGPDHWRAQK